MKGKSIVCPSNEKIIKCIVTNQTFRITVTVRVKLAQLVNRQFEKELFGEKVSRRSREGTRRLDACVECLSSRRAVLDFGRRAQRRALPLVRGPDEKTALRRQIKTISLVKFHQSRIINCAKSMIVLHISYRIARVFL